MCCYTLGDKTVKNMRPDAVLLSRHSPDGNDSKMNPRKQFSCVLHMAIVLATGSRTEMPWPFVRREGKEAFLRLSGGNLCGDRTESEEVC